MDRITRYYKFSDFLKDVDEGLTHFAPPSFTFLQGELYNPETHDLIPKKSYVKKEIEFKEEKLRQLKLRKENDMKAYESQEKTLSLEIEQLKQRL